MNLVSFSKQDFFTEPDPHWRQYSVGAGAIQRLAGTLRLATISATSSGYSDAQLDDYAGLPRRRFPWSPPVSLAVRARFSHPVGELRGTGGFGFWNDPFLMSGARLPTLPRAIWFFYASSPSDLKLDRSTPGCGWKAATIDALRPVAGLLAPLAPAAAMLMNVRSVYRALWPSIQGALRIREALIDVDLTEWHTYSLDWGPETASFAVDEAHILSGAPSPRGPLGFVMWLDNQYMVVTPWGRFGWGLLDVPGSQWLEVDSLSIEPEQ
jgi:hypothetical protein